MTAPQLDFGLVEVFRAVAAAGLPSRERKALLFGLGAQAVKAAMGRDVPSSEFGMTESGRRLDALDSIEEVHQALGVASTTEAHKCLRGMGRVDLSRRLSRVSRVRNGVAHPDVRLIDDIHEASQVSRHGSGSEPEDENCTGQVLQFYVGEASKHVGCQTMIETDAVAEKTVFDEGIVAVRQDISEIKHQLDDFIKLQQRLPSHFGDGTLDIKLEHSRVDVAAWRADVDKTIAMLDLLPPMANLGIEEVLPSVPDEGTRWTELPIDEVDCERSEVGRDTDEERDLLEKAEQGAINEIERQLMLPSANGTVWITGWSKRFGKTLGPLLLFLNAHPERFEVVPGVGKKFTVQLAQSGQRPQSTAEPGQQHAAPPAGATQRRTQQQQLQVGGVRRDLQALVDLRARTIVLLGQEHYLVSMVDRDIEVERRLREHESDEVPNFVLA